MTFEFFLPSAGTVKNIQLRLSDQQQKKTFSFRTFLRISEEDWDTEKQRPKNIYLKKYKKLNTKLDMIKKELAEYVCKMRMEKKCCINARWQGRSKQFVSVIFWSCRKILFLPRLELRIQ